MLGEFEVFATVAVKDLEESKKFYGETLGLKQLDDNEGGITYEGSPGKIFIYQAPTAGTGQATCANWHVKNIKDVAEELKSKGVSFEHYEFPGAEHDGDVHIMGGMKAAWFKDPSGNILGIGEAA